MAKTESDAVEKLKEELKAIYFYAAWLWSNKHEFLNTLQISVYQAETHLLLQIPQTLGTSL